MIKCGLWSQRPAGLGPPPAGSLVPRTPREAGKLHMYKIVYTCRHSPVAIITWLLRFLYIIYMLFFYLSDPCIPFILHKDNSLEESEILSESSFFNNACVAANLPTCYTVQT